MKEAAQSPLRDTHQKSLDQKFRINRFQGIAKSRTFSNAVQQGNVAAKTRKGGTGKIRKIRSVQDL